MPFRYSLFLSIAITAGLLTPGELPAQSDGTPRGDGGSLVVTGPGKDLVLPEPWATPSVRKRSVVMGWPQGRTPTPLPGFQVSLFADNLNNPRQLYVLPNGDVLVTESIRESLSRGRKSANRITLLRDADQDGNPELREAFLRGLHMPFGMALVGKTFYVGNTDGLVRYPYRPGQTRITAPGEKILDLPAGGHYTRNVIANGEASKLYLSVGSRTNVAEQGIDARDKQRAAILEVNPDGSGMRVFASGLRNPVGLDWEPRTNTLWTVVNERDRLGDELVPDYLTRVREGAFYGWPYSYFGQHPEPRQKGRRPDLVAKAVVPDYALGSHRAPLGLVFYEGTSFPRQYHGGAFIGLHGSWNRSRFVGYKVAFVPFRDGQPSGPLQDFLTGFIANEEASQVYGRPVGVAVAADGSLLVADDGGGKVWRVSATGSK